MSWKASEKEQKCSDLYKTIGKDTINRIKLIQFNEEFKGLLQKHQIPKDIAEQLNNNRRMIEAQLVADTKERTMALATSEKCEEQDVILSGDSCDHELEQIGHLEFRLEQYRKKLDQMITMQTDKNDYRGMFDQMNEMSTLEQKIIRRFIMNKDCNE